MTKARDIASAAPAPSTVSVTELGYLDGVTSAIQTQIDSKIGSASAINPSIIAAKGDLIVGTANDTVGILTKGTDTYTLVADSAEATGLKWAAPAGATSFPAFSASKQTTTQTITAGTWTKITFTNELFDTAGNFASSTFTPTTAGYYQVGSVINIDPSSSSYVQVNLYKNGTSYQFLGGLFASADESYIGGSVVVAMNGTTDYLEIYARCGQNADVFAGANITNFNGVGIRGL